QSAAIYFFFQAEDGIRDRNVTGVQTCALPILRHGQKRFRAQQIWDWLYKKRVKNFAQMRNLNQDCIALLKENFSLDTLEEEMKQESQDGTIKFLFRLADGNLIETVLMR